MKEYSDQELVAVIGKAPQIIQDQIGDSEMLHVVVAIATAHGLHVDAIGVLARLNTYLLLGLISPQEFVQELIRMQISEADAKQILEEINQKIFAPMHDKMRAGEQGAPPSLATPIEPVTVPIPARPIAPPPPPRMPATPPQQTMPTLIPKPLNRLQPQQIVGGALVLQHAAPPPVQQPKPPTPAQQISTPPTANKPLLAAALRAAGVPMLSNREVPHINVSKPVAPAPGPVAKPATPPAAPAKPAPTSDLLPKPQTPAAPVIPAKPLVTGYSVDPYRAQPEEHEK